jgi:chromosome segregation ATPase
MRDPHTESIAAPDPASGRSPGTESRFDRLSRAVTGLIARCEALGEQNLHLAAEVAKRDEQLRVLNQRRQDALKRIDDLIAQIDHLDTRFEAED